MFCLNQSHPEVIEAGKKAFDTHGAGLSSTRFICGTMVRKAQSLFCPDVVQMLLTNIATGVSQHCA